MKKRFLIAPGPTAVSEDVMLEMAKPLIHHRTPEFSDIFMQATDKLKQVYQTKNDVYILAASGTGAMEAAVANVVSPGDKVIVVRAGKFGERWGQLCETYKANPIYIDLEWGDDIDLDKLANIVRENPDVKALFCQYSETSSATAYPIKEMAAIMKESDGIIVVDAITGLGVMELPTDEWGVDIVVSGAQKAFMIPPGIAFISVSQKAFELIEKSSSPKYYFDLIKYKKSLAKKTTPYTPAITLIIGLNKALDMMLEEGLDKLIKRHSVNADAVRAGLKALNLKLMPKVRPSDSVTAAYVPDGIDGKKIPTLMRDKYGITIAGGQDPYKGKIFRIGHMGYIDKSDIVVVLCALEYTLKDLGYDFDMGASIKAAMPILYEYYGKGD